jgi:phosphorylcholine metabolism protein LicD
MKNKTNKRAQEEMVGFVLIVVIVVIVAVIFLGISLRKPDTTASQKSEELNSFLSSLSYYTTECEIDPTYPRTISDLVGDCKENKICTDNRLACEVLESTLKSILNNSTYVVSDDSSTIYYKLSVYYGLNEESGKLIEPISKTQKNQQIGVCSGAKIYNIKSFGEETEEDNIHMKFEVCYINS